MLHVAKLQTSYVQKDHVLVCDTMMEKIWSITTDKKDSLFSILINGELNEAWQQSKNIPTKYYSQIKQLKKVNWENIWP